MVTTLLCDCFRDNTRPGSSWQLDFVIRGFLVLLTIHTQTLFRVLSRRRVASFAFCLERITTLNVQWFFAFATFRVNFWTDTLLHTQYTRAAVGTMVLSQAIDGHLLVLVLVIRIVIVTCHLCTTTTSGYGGWALLLS